MAAARSGAVDGVVKNHAAQRADVNRARGRLGVVYDLRPRQDAASSSAQYTAGRLADFEDLVREVAGGNVTTTDSPLCLPSRLDRRAIRWRSCLRGAGLGGADDGEDFLAVGAVDLHGAADLDVIGAVIPVDDRRVLHQGLEPLDLPSTNACSFLASSYSAFSQDRRAPWHRGSAGRSRHAGR